MLHKDYDRKDSVAKEKESLVVILKGLGVIGSKPPAVK
jgi:hypothetical protein